MSVELSVATTNFMGDTYTFLDCPGSVEFVHDMRAVLPAIDAAVVVCEMDEKKVPQLQLILRELEDQKIPRILFLNKIDKADAAVHDVLKLLQAGLAHQAGTAADSDLLRRDRHRLRRSRARARLRLQGARALARSCRSKATPLDREKTARFSMLETLADHDDELMEQLLEDIQPPRDKVFDDLARELRDGLVCPVLMGTATRANGVLRLLKALRQKSPGSAETAKRLGVKAGADAVAYVVKTLNTDPRRQDVDRARARRPGRRRHHLRSPGTTRPAASPASSSWSARRPRSADRPLSARPSRFAKLDKAKTGDTLTAGKQAHPPLAKIEPYPPVLAIAISAKERKDDVKLGQALNKLAEEDPSITVVHNPETHEVVLWGQGEMHLRVATERLGDRLRRRHRAAPADRRLPRDHPQGHRAARPAQEAVGRPRPIRRRRARHQADAARFGLHLRGQDHRRRGAAQLHPLGRGGRHRRAQARPARLSGGRPARWR